MTHVLLNFYEASVKHGQPPPGREVRRAGAPHWPGARGRGHGRVAQPPLPDQLRHPVPPQGFAYGVQVIVFRTVLITLMEIGTISAKIFKFPNFDIQIFEICQTCQSLARLDTIWHIFGTYLAIQIIKPKHF